MSNELHKTLERIANREGISVSQLLLKTAEEYCSQTELFERVRSNAERRDTREDFENFLAAVPDVEPKNPLDRIKD